MKRSEVNALIDQTIALLHKHHIKLPPFGYWSPADWKKKGHECDEIRDCMLGWDITDFGLGQFDKIGLALFTVRNGHNSIEAYKAKTYCEKLLIANENQMTPMHFHTLKQEDIICRCGGNLVIELYNRGADDQLADSDVTVSLDGVRRTVKAGARLALKPGESITLPPFLYHKFWAEEGTGTSIVGEVSKVNDDATDNTFYERVGRFPKIEEDRPAKYCLCTEYPPAS